jgi:hypothetical protein
VRGTPLSPQLWILRRYFPPQIGGVRVYSAKLIRRTTIPDASSSMRARNGAPKKKKKKKTTTKRISGIQVRRARSGGGRFISISPGVMIDEFPITF